MEEEKLKVPVYADTHSQASGRSQARKKLHVAQNAHRRAEESQPTPLQVYAAGCRRFQPCNQRNNLIY